MTEEQSATYNDFTLLNVGGVDVNGEDAVNDLSYLILDVIVPVAMISFGVDFAIHAASRVTEVPGKDPVRRWSEGLSALAPALGIAVASSACDSRTTHPRSACASSMSRVRSTRRPLSGSVSATCRSSTTPPRGYSTRSTVAVRPSRKGARQLRAAMA